jgi:SAM-dependent methyltransferase
VGPLYQADLAYIQAAAFGALARGAALEIVQRLRTARYAIHRVVDVGCGAGPLAQVLVEEGFEVMGVDGSAELLEIARAAVPTAHFIHASIHDIEIPACDAIVAVGEPLTYHTDTDDADLLIRQFFRRASAVLPDGGLLIFDIIECGAPSLSGRFWSSGDDWAVLVDTVEDPVGRTLVRDIQTFRCVGELYRRGREVHRVHLFEPGTLREELAACGFEVHTARAFGTQPLGPRRQAFFASRVNAKLPVPSVT